MRFYVGNNTSGDPSWWLFGANDELAAWAGETFASESNARRAALAFKAGAATAGDVPWGGVDLGAECHVENVVSHRAMVSENCLGIST